ncbi:MAG: DNA cytosine methyltransferase, partial [Proteobacteria bacterium]
MPIPIIDLFAGPGGLGEGFSSLLNDENRKLFKIVLSIEKDREAHKTLTLRSFFRQFEIGEVPYDYYKFLQGSITIDELYNKWPVQFEEAKREAWCAELGNGPQAVRNTIVDQRIIEALNGEEDWILIGGPPCQAYSNIGRSRRKEKVLDGKKDARVELYKQYLRILAVHNPSVFVMENVKGLLSAETNESPVFTKILEDLKDPVAAYQQENPDEFFEQICPGYKIYSLIKEPEGYDINGDPIIQQKDFVIRAEKYGIPQTRHRVILLGVRRDIEITPRPLGVQSEVPISKVISGL